MRFFCVNLMMAMLSAPAAGAGEVPPPQQVHQIMRLVCDYELKRREGSVVNDWVRSTFYTGVMATYHTTGDRKYLDAAMQWGAARNFTPIARRHADMHTAGQVYLELYMIENDPAMLEPIRMTFEAMMADPLPGREEWWWCDALYMAPPALARLYAATGDHRYVAYMNDLWWDTTDFLFDAYAGLFYRDSNYFNRTTRHGHRVFWSRGNGWVMGGIVRVLEHLPESDPYHGRYVELLQQMAAAVAALQGEDGLWGSSLHDADHFPEPETSGTAFFCYALAWGINNGYLDRATYLPVVTKAWQGLVDHVNEDGRLGSVQAIAASPGAVRAEDTFDYAVGAFLLAGSEVAKLRALRFDFGSGPVEQGFVRVSASTMYSPERGYGWVEEAELHDRDRGQPARLRRSFILGRSPATFRIDLEPGTYRLTLVMGDVAYADHIMRFSVDAAGVELPELHPALGEFVTVTAAFEVERPALHIELDSPVNNWIINGLVLEPADDVEPVAVQRELVRVPPRDTWVDVAALPDPIELYVDRFHSAIDGLGEPGTTGLSREDYLKLIAGNVEYFLTLQNEDGAIIDPHKDVEWQYATPSFALAAAALMAHGRREDLLEPAAKAMDWSVESLRRRRAATAHEDFYPPLIAHALPLLKPRVAAERWQRWEEQIRSFDPFATYRSPPGGANWSVVSLSGEALFYKLGLRDDLEFVEHYLAGQGRHFASPWGLYTEGPMPYDHFPRMWAADLLAAGYAGKYAEPLREALRRGALTSLFMQSPTGEAPTGGRSSHHQWNEGQQCVTFEIYAAQALADGDEKLAGVFKRAARLSLKAMQRWQRPSGELWIVKNRVDPARRHGYEPYSAHSQYNLLAMAMLAIGHHHAEATEHIEERPIPAEVGGFVLHLEPVFRMVFANAGGNYVQITTGGDQRNNPTGLLRIHRRGANPQLGPSDGLVAGPSYQLPGPERTTAAVGVEWQDLRGQWRRLAEVPREHLSRVSLLDVHESPQRVSFQLIYQGYFSGPALVSERYVVTPEEVELAVELPGYDGPRRLVWPLLADDGEQQTTIRQDGPVVTVSLGEDVQTFVAEGATAVRVDEQLYPHRNGWMRLAIAEFDPGAAAKLRIQPEKANP